MIIYIKGDFTKNITFGYEELAHKMWTKEINGKELVLSHYGNDESLQEDFDLGLSHAKWENDDRWYSPEILALHSSLEREGILMEFEKARLSNYREKGDHLFIASSHTEMLTVDRRALCIMVIEVAKAIDGLISEDGKSSWMSVEAFKNRHQDVLSLSFEEAYELAFQEIFEITAVDNPIWDELDRLEEEYNLIHGERSEDDYEYDDSFYEEYDYIEVTDDELPHSELRIGTLSFALQELKDYVNKGEDFLYKGLMSSAINNRNASLRTLKSWVDKSQRPLKDLSPKLYHRLLEAEQLEPEADVRKRMQALLSEQFSTDETPR